MDPSIHSVPSRLTTLQQEGKPQYEQSLKSPSVVIKWAQLMVTLLCLLFFSHGSHLLEGNAGTVHFHYIVYSSFAIITTGILLSYIIGMKMREVLMRLFNCLGAIMYLASWLISVQDTVTFWPDWKGHIEEQTDEVVEAIRKQRISVIIACLCAFCNFCLYLADASYSFWRTLSLL